VYNSVHLHFNLSYVGIYLMPPTVQRLQCCRNVFGCVCLCM